MTARLFVCVAISTCLHALVIIQPWNIVAKSGNADILPVTVPVQLVEETEAFLKEAQEEQEIPDEGVSFEVEGEVSADYLDLLKMKIFTAWEYPEDAIEKGHDGIVRITFVLGGAGDLTEIGVLTSSGHYSLDAAAMGAIERASPFGPFTEDVTGRTLKITGNFRYVLD
jgi:TonB family protein